MATIGNLVIALSAKTGSFVSGMKQSERQVQTFASVVGRATGILGGFFAASSSVRAFAQQEQALRRLGDALSLTSSLSKGTLSSMEAFASEMQQLTTIGDETVLAMLATGASIGRLGGHELQEATKAAIGLSRVLGTDANAAMLLVARAAAGNTSTLSRYGIQLDETMTAQERFAEVLKIGAAGFRLAEGEAQTATGRIAQLGNSVSDLQETFGGLISNALAPAVVLLNRAAKGANDLASRLVRDVAQAAAFSAGFLAAGKAMELFVAVGGRIVTVLRNIAKGQTIVTALSGPSGIAKLAVGLAAGAAASIVVDNAFSKMVDTSAQLESQLGATSQASSVLANRLTEDAQKTADAQDSLIQSLQDEVAALSMSERQVTLFKLAQSGATAETIRLAESLLDQKASLESMRIEADKAAQRMEDLRNKAREVFEATRTPVENLATELAGLQQLLTAGLIDWETFSRAVANAGDEMNEAAKPRTFRAPDVSAATRGSQAAISAIARFQSSTADKSLEIEKRQFQVQQQMRDALARIDVNTRQTTTTTEQTVNF